MRLCNRFVCVSLVRRHGRRVLHLRVRPDDELGVARFPSLRGMDDDAAVSDGIEEMSEADETDSDSDEYVPSLEESEDIFAPRAPCARSTRPAGQKAK